MSPTRAAFSRINLLLQETLRPAQVNRVVLAGVAVVEAHDFGYPVALYCRSAEPSGEELLQLRSYGTFLLRQVLRPGVFARVLEQPIPYVDERQNTLILTRRAEVGCWHFRRASYETPFAPYGPDAEALTLVGCLDRAQSIGGTPNSAWEAWKERYPATFPTDALTHVELR